MQQSKLESHLEAFVNQASGYIISLCLWHFIMAPLLKKYHIDITTGGASVGITTVFFIVSYVRSFFWRRFFNAGLHKVIHRLVTRYMSK